jgi:hypothetical protein
MPPYRPTSTSDSESGSESDAPEIVSLSQSKKAVKQQAKELNEFSALQKQKRKEKNRAKDRRLKDQASNSRRVKRALVSTTGPSSDNSDESEADSGSDEEEEEQEDVGAVKTNPDYLPDHLFADAFPPKPPAKSVAKTAKVASVKKPSRKKRRNAQKDLILGYIFIHLHFRSALPDMLSL